MVNEDLNAYIGKRIKSYTIQEKLGSGGSACVYLSQNQVHEYAAIKIFNQDYIKYEGQQFFRQEIEILQELKHYHYILSIIDYGKYEGVPYIITEYTPGGTLRKRINTFHPTEIEKILTILTQISHATYAAHLHNIVHNDLKPENILFNKKDEAVLADFGIAVRLGRRKKILGRPHGTYAYMAPEQFNGVYAKEGDQYSLGCIAYELLTGRHPFENLPNFNPYDFKIMQKLHRNSKPPPLREFNSAIPVDVEQTILTSMAKLPSERHSSIIDFVHALQLSLLALPQATHHFIYPLDTPPPYTSSFVELPIPAISPDSAAVTLPSDQEAGEIGHIQASSTHALYYPNYHYPPKQIFPQNIDDEQVKHTDRNIPPNVPEKLEGITDRRTKKAPPPNPLKTRDLQLRPDLTKLLDQLLKNLGLKLYSNHKQHPITSETWTYTAIAADKSGTVIEFVPQYSIIYLPGNLLTTDKNINNMAMMFTLFSQEVLIIFTDTRVDFDIKIDNLIDHNKRSQNLKIGIIKHKHIRELENSKDIESQLYWLNKYLKSEYLSLKPREVEPDGVGTLEASTKTFLQFFPDIQNFLEDFGSANLKKVLLENEIIQSKVPHMTAHNIIKRLNEPPYHPDSTGHTLLGEFLCLLLKKPNFTSSTSQEAQDIKRIIRKYRLGPPSCLYCSS